MDDEQLAAHLDRLAAWIWEKPFESCADDPLCAVAIFDFGEPDASALCVTEIRGCTASERHRLVTLARPVHHVDAQEGTAVLDPARDRSALLVDAARPCPSAR